MLKRPAHLLLHGEVTRNRRESLCRLLETIKVVLHAPRSPPSRRLLPLLNNHHLLIMSGRPASWLKLVCSSTRARLGKMRRSPSISAALRLVLNASTRSRRTLGVHRCIGRLLETVEIVDVPVNFFDVDAGEYRQCLQGRLTTLPVQHSNGALGELE